MSLTIPVLGWADTVPPTLILDAIATSVTDQMAHWLLEARSIWHTCGSSGPSEYDFTVH